MTRTWQAGAPYAQDHPLVGRVLMTKSTGISGTIRGVLWPWLDVQWSDGDWTYSDGRMFPELAASSTERGS